MGALVTCNGRPWCQALVLPGRLCMDCRKGEAKTGTHPASDTTRTAAEAQHPGSFTSTPGTGPPTPAHRTVDVASGARREKDRKTPGTDPRTDTHRTVDGARLSFYSFANPGGDPVTVCKRTAQVGCSEHVRPPHLYVSTVAPMPGGHPMIALERTVAMGGWERYSAGGTGG
jgi:hypothetical protein